MLADLIKEKYFFKVNQLHFIIIDKDNTFTSQYWLDLYFHLKINHYYNMAFYL